ncbi:hypothetical protein ACIRU8_44295 [Streptomyces sp. NPDC101175]|uniref:hypothetical protein n=1 Tax=Streptomyces sp. NPDC101175 TaxID=3366123 RepID=UPI003837F7BC
MTDVRDLWWRAGKTVFPVSADKWRNESWEQAVHRSATLLEPAWPKDYSGGPFVFALPTVALVLYAGVGGIGRPEYAPVDKLVEALTPPQHGAGESGESVSLEDAVRAGLTKHGHDLDDDSQLSALFHYLADYREPITHGFGGMELPSMDQWPGGTLMKDAARWAQHKLAYHHLSADHTA